MDVLNFTTILDLLDPTKVVNDVVVGLILAIFGIIAGIVVFKYEWRKAEEHRQKENLEQEQIKTREELNGCIHQHHQDLIINVLEPWYKHDVVSIEKEPFVIDHLKTGYADNAGALWFEYKNIVRNISKDKKTIKEYIKNKSREGIPLFSELDDVFNDDYLVSNNAEQDPDEQFREVTLVREADTIYELVDYFATNGILKEDVYYKELVEALVKDKSIYKQINIVNDSKKNLNKKLFELEHSLKKIVCDFEEIHVELEGTCKICKDWHEKLKSLK